MEDNEKHFIKAFNDGYLLSKHEPELLNVILQGDRSNTPYIQAMALGKEQYDMEKEKDKDKSMDEKVQDKNRYPSWLTRDRSNRSDPEPDRDKDKDLDRDIEPER